MAVTIEEFMIDVSTRMSGNDAQTLEKVGDTVRGLLSTFGKLIGITGGIYGVGAAIRDFVSDAVDLQRVSNATGASVENLSTWVNAMNGAGEKGEQFLQTVKGVSSSLQDMFTGAGSSILPFFNELGIAILDENNNLRDTTEILGDLAKTWDQYSPQRQQKIGEMIGLDDATIRFLQLGGEEVERLLEIQKKLGVVNAEQAKTSKEIQTNYYQLQQIWSAASNMLVGKLLPAVNWMMKGLKSLSMWIVEHKAVIYGFVMAIIGVLLFKLVPTLIAVAAAWMWAMAPVLLVIGLLSVLGAALYYLIDDFMVWKEGGEAAFTGLWEVVDPIITKIVDAFKRLKDYLVYAWNEPKQAWNEAVTYFQDRWKGMSLLEIGKDIVKSLWDGMMWYWNELVVPFWDSIDGLFKSKFDISLYDAGAATINSWWNGIKSGWTQLSGWVRELINDMQAMFVAGDFEEIGRKAGEAVVDAIVTAWKFLTDPSNIDWKGIASMIADGLVTVLEAIITFVGSVAQVIGGFIKGLLGSLWKEIEDGFDKVLSYVGLGSKKIEEPKAGEPGGPRDTNTGEQYTWDGVPISREQPEKPRAEMPVQPTYPVGQFGASYADNRRAEIERQLVQMRGGDVNVAKIEVNAPGGTAKSVSDGMTNAFERLRQKGFNMADSGVNP